MTGRGRERVLVKINSRAEELIVEVPKYFHVFFTVRNLKNSPPWFSVELDWDENFGWVFWVNQLHWAGFGRFRVVLAIGAKGRRRQVRRVF